jgi:hypothetical protein
MEQEVKSGIMLSHIAKYSSSAESRNLKLSQFAKFSAFAFSRQVLFACV